MDGNPCGCRIIARANVKAPRPLTIVYCDLHFAAPAQAKRIAELEAMLKNALEKALEQALAGAESDHPTNKD